LSEVVIITRAQPGAAETGARIAALGYVPILSSAIELRAITPPPDLSTTHTDGLIFTSANGVRFFAEMTDARTHTAWCVGPATASAAQIAGFTDMRNAHGNADDLATLIIAEAAPGARLLHVANEAAAGNLAATLRKAGFAVGFAAPYRAIAARALSPQAIDALSGPCTVLIHSAKGAEAFAALAEPLAPPALSAIAVSEKAAAPLAGLCLVRLRIAAHPNEDGLMDALQAL
jgi:uroporphyrinogen-III synthase